MSESGEVKKWIIRVSGTVGGTIILLALAAQLSHYARSGETEERSRENEQRNVEQDKALAPIRELVEKLGNRAAAEDAALERDAELCRQGVITDKMICGAAGEDIDE